MTHKLNRNYKLKKQNLANEMLKFCRNDLVMGKFLGNKYRTGKRLAEDYLTMKRLV